LGEAEHRVVGTAPDDEGVDGVEEGLIAVRLVERVHDRQPVDAAVAARDVAVEAGGDEDGEARPSRRWLAGHAAMLPLPVDSWGAAPRSVTARPTAVRVEATSTRRRPGQRRARRLGARLAQSSGVLQSTPRPVPPSAPAEPLILFGDSTPFPYAGDFMTMLSAVVEGCAA